MRRKIIATLTAAVAAVLLAITALAGAAPASAVSYAWTSYYVTSCDGGTAHWAMRWLGSGAYVRPDGYDITLITPYHVWIDQVTLRSFDANNGNKQAGVYTAYYSMPYSNNTAWGPGEDLYHTGIPNGFTQATAWTSESIFAEWGNLYIKMSDLKACSISPVLSAV